MPTIQIWLDNLEMDTLRRLKAYFEHVQVEIFEHKSFRVGVMSGSAGRRRRIRRRNINDSYVFRQALGALWEQYAESVGKFEDRERY